VLSAIEFDHQLQLEADEIDDISADWRLPPELGAADLPIAQPIPKTLLGLGLINAQLACEVAHGISVS